MGERIYLHFPIQRMTASGDMDCDEKEEKKANDKRTFLSAD
jgi:hypothetical protein